MGNANPQVQAQADFITGTNRYEGFARDGALRPGGFVRGPAGGRMTALKVAAATTVRPLSLAFATARPNKEAAP
jgi:hypothetical protein